VSKEDTLMQAMDQGNPPEEPAAGLPGLLRLERSDVEPAAQALAREFFDEPMMQYIWPQDRMRSGMLPVFMRAAIKITAPHRESFTTPGSPEGAALFLPPGKTVIPPGPMMRVLLPDIWRWRPGPFMRFMGIVNEFE